MSFFKKIHPPLQEAIDELGWSEPTALQQQAIGPLKSGGDAFIVDEPQSGKSSLLQCFLIQQLKYAQGESTRALVVLDAKESVLEWAAQWAELAKYTDLRLYSVHDKSDVDYDKNQLSLGCDVLVGTPDQLTRLFAGAGFNGNSLRYWALDAADQLMQLRKDKVLLRLAMSIENAQRLVFAQEPSERLLALTDKFLDEEHHFLSTSVEMESDDEA